MKDEEDALGAELPAAASCLRVRFEMAARCVLVNLLGAVCAIRRRADVPAALVGGTEIAFELPGLDGICSTY